MSRLFAYIANDPARVACALYPARRQLIADAVDRIDSWGIGFYQDEVLLQRRPMAPSEPIDFYAVARDLRTDCIVGHARAGTVGKPKSENTHPFRFRQWLFAHHGTVPRFAEVQPALLEAVPEHLRRNIRGQTDSEHVFHLLLAELHEAGKLDDASLSSNVLRDALRATLLRLEGLVGRDEMRAAECVTAVTNGRTMLVSRQGPPVHLMRVRAVTDCAVCREPVAAGGRPPKRIDHEHLKSVLIVADAPAPATGWEEVPDRTLVGISRELSVELSPI